MWLIMYIIFKKVGTNLHISIQVGSLVTQEYKVGPTITYTYI